MTTPAITSDATALPPGSSHVLLGAAAAYRAAIADGYTHADSIYCHPRAKIKLTKLLAKAEKHETEWPHLARDKWEYYPERDYIKGPTDQHGLFRAPNK